VWLCCLEVNLNPGLYRQKKTVRPWNEIRFLAAVQRHVLNTILYSAWHRHHDHQHASLFPGKHEGRIWLT
jgi:hypothetical protein